MTRRWTIVLFSLLFSFGCDQQAANKTLDESKTAEPQTIPATPILTREDAIKASNKTRQESTPKPDAHVILKEAVATAKADDKALLVHFSADW